MNNSRKNNAARPTHHCKPPRTKRSPLGHLARSVGLALLLLSVGWWGWPYVYAALASSSTTVQSQNSEDSKYVVSPGVYRQVNSDSGERYLSIDGSTEGRLIIELTQLSGLVIGARRVEIDTSWEVDEDDVTFYLHQGRPEASYQRLLTLKLEKETRFHIREWKKSTLTLERVVDGEMFRWERTGDEPLPNTKSSMGSESTAVDG